MSEPSYIVDAVRTPIGRHGGALAGVRPDDLAAATLSGLLARVDGIDPASIDDVYLGAANGAGEDNRNVARMAALLAGLPTAVPGSTSNRLCGSGMEALIQGSRAVACGDAELCIAGGVESMSRAPWVLMKPERGFARGHETLHSTTLGWRMVNSRMHDEWTVALGEGAELLADKFGIDREAQDEFAVRSHHAAAQAWQSGAFRDEIIAVPEADLDTDESIRADTTVERLAELRPVFRPDGSVTAGNSSPLNDGAAALLLASETAARRLRRRPLARVAARAVAAVEPQLFGIGPVEACETALKRAGIGWGDLDAVELNEAFAAQALACLRSWPELDPGVVNANGGAIALGHPLGASGARIVATLVWHLRHAGGRWGLATACIGVGQGIAIVVEAEAA